MSGIRRSVITDEISQDIAVAADLASEFALNALEIRSAFGAGPHELSASQRKAIRDEAAARNLAICAVAGPVFKCSLFDDGEIEKNYDILRACVDAAHDFGCTVVRTFAFWREKVALAEALPRIAEHLRKAAAIAGDTGLTLALEHDPTLFASNAAHIAAILDAVNSPRLAALWDPGNDLYDPFRETPYPDGYALLRGRIAHVHVKDAVRAADGEATCVRLGDGAVDWPGQLRALARDGYDGYYSLETHYRAAKPLDESLLRLPGGHAFSDGAYEATKACLRAWQTW